MYAMNLNFFVGFERTHMEVSRTHRDIHISLLVIKEHTGKQLELVGKLYISCA